MMMTIRISLMMTIRGDKVNEGRVIVIEYENSKGGNIHL